MAPALSLGGLVIVAAVSFALLGGSLPALPGGPGNGGPIRTPTPSNVVVIPKDPRASIPGSLLYVKDHNLWAQSGDTARQLTGGGGASMPTWSPDGAFIYYVKSRPEEGRWPSGGIVRTYRLSVPSLVKVGADGTGTAQVLLTGRLTRGVNTWSYFIREPAISPDGRTAAIITDGPDPTASDIVVKLLDLTTLTLTDPRLGQTQSLGHQDPAWAPDGRSLLYVRNAREGARGTPAIFRYDVATRRSKALTGPGYSGPAWSRDGRYVAATKTGTLGTDIVILDASNGAELLRLTNDLSSFSPVWSPRGDAIAYFRVEHGVVDLQLALLAGTAPQWTAGEPVPLTLAAGLDASSRPAWFIPADQLPPLPTAPATPATPGASPGASSGVGSAAP